MSMLLQVGISVVMVTGIAGGARRVPVLLTFDLDIGDARYRVRRLPIAKPTR